MSTDNGNAEPRRIRTSDAERERVAAILRDAVSEGRLSLEEGDERLAALYQTKFRDELGVLTVDLPGEEPAGRRGRRGGPANPPGWGGQGGGGQGWGGQGWGGQGWGGQGWGSPAGGPGPQDTDGPAGAEPGAAGPQWGGGPGPGWGGPGGHAHGPWGHHHRGPFGRLVFVALLIFAIATLTGGHFFWPIIPIVFVSLALVRCGLFAMWRRRWSQR